MPARVKFVIVRDKAWEALQMLRELLELEQTTYHDAISRYWEGPTNPVEIPVDGQSEIFDPNQASDGCPSWREMGFRAMAIPFSLHCDRFNDFHRQYTAYILGASFLWSGLHADDHDKLSLISRLLRWDGVEWRDTGWREYPAGLDASGELMFAEGIPIETEGGE